MSLSFASKLRFYTENLDFVLPFSKNHKMKYYLGNYRFLPNTNNMQTFLYLSHAIIMYLFFRKVAKNINFVYFYSELIKDKRDAKLQTQSKINVLKTIMLWAFYM